MSVLHSISEPADVRTLSSQALLALAKEMREHLIASVSTHGGHLGPNLGVVELTIALHRVFDSPNEPIIFDTGHQSYVHKLLTGRKDFSKLRQAEGISGYPSRAESVHDIVENSHASTSLSWAYGIDVAKRRQREIAAASSTGSYKNTQRDCVVAVIGDGALTGGMAFEAINMIAADPDCRVVIVVNDNERSYAPTIGGLAKHLSALRTADGYEWTLDKVKQNLHKMGPGGRLALEALHGMKKGLKDMIAPQTMFEDIGLKYIGPIDGHDIGEIEVALQQAKQFQGPLVVHTITEKGHGYKPAVNKQDDQMHAVGPIHPDTGLPIKAAGTSWTGLFSEEMVRIATEHPHVVGITAAMQVPVGLDKMARMYPERVLDVGIAEQHATTLAAGLASQGIHPFVAVYATFLNRAFDQILMDVALHKEGVTFVLDRAGVTGPDGASHHGMWDISMLSIVPGLHFGAPRDAKQLGMLMDEAIHITNGPSVIRLPKDSVSKTIPAIGHIGTSDVVYSTTDQQGDKEILIIAQGPMVTKALQAATILENCGFNVDIIDPRWFFPIDNDLVTHAKSYFLTVTIEDGVTQGGMGQAIGTQIKTKNPAAQILNLGLPITFINHDSRSNILRHYMLDPVGIVAQIMQEFNKIAALPSDTISNFGRIATKSATLEEAVVREEQL